MIELSERNQMILKLAALFGVTLLIGASLYFLFFRSKPIVTPIPNGEGSVQNPGGGLPTASPGTGGGSTGGSGTGGTGTGSLPPSSVANGGSTTSITLTTSEINEPTVMADGTVAYYDPADGRFYTIDKNGNVKPLTDAHFPEAETIVFSSAANEAVIEFPDGSNVVYDFQSGDQVTLPSHWEDFSFSDDGEEIVGKSISRDPSARALVVTSADGSQTSVIAALGTNSDKVSVNWSPDGSVLGFSATGEGGSAFGQNQIFLLGPDGDDVGVLIVNGTNFSPLWSPDSSHILYSVADAGNDYRATLWYADKDGDRQGAARKQIALQTIAEKCTFASDAVAYCAVPTVMPSGGGTSASFLTSPDEVYKIDLASGRTTLIAIPTVNTQMFNLRVSPALDTLYYTDRLGRLSYMKLR